MWKFFGKRFGRSSGASVAKTPSGSLADLRGKFYLDKHCTHGFPLAPSCMTYDPHRHVLFIGTTSGELRMLGKPGVELTGVHDDINKILQILPFASEPSVITICANNIMHKWSLVDSEGNSRLVLKRTYRFQGGLAKTITTCCLPPHCDCLFVGTLGGITYPMDTEFDGMSPEVLSWSRARAYLKYKGKDVPGEVRSLEISPVNPKQLLIAYEHNYLELWDALTWKPKAIFGPFKEENLGDILASCWHTSGSQFLTTHKSGAIALWSLDNAAKPINVTRFHGDERVREPRMICWPSDNLYVMSGGTPVGEVDGDSMTIVDHDQIISLQLTSAVKGMHVLEDYQSDRDSGIVNTASSDRDNAGTPTTRRILVLLLEQEILFVELTLPELPLLRPPYLCSLHNSPVKCVNVYSNVNRDIWQTISQVGRVQQEAIYQSHIRAWPINGGHLEPISHDRRDLFITGHEDGTIKFWDIREISMHLLYVLNCSQFFNTLDTDFFPADSPDNEEEEGEESEGRARKHKVKQIGFWDPRSDDDQIQISNVQFYDNQLLVSFHGGKVLLFQLNHQSANAMVKLHRVSILRDDPRQRGRNWQAPLDIRTDGIECAPGYQPTHCFGIFPNVSVTTIALAKEQHVVGIGCIYGFTIIDYLKNTTVHVQSTFDASNPEPGHLSRMQSIRRSFRQSLKRLNVRQSMRGMQSIRRSYRPNFVRSGSMRPSMKNRSHGGVVGVGGASAIGGGGIGVASAAGSAEVTPVPVRRDSIRQISFVAPCHIAGNSVVQGVLVSTNQGGVLGFTMDMPSAKHRATRSPIMMPIDKEFNQKRNHATIFAGVVDSQNYLLDVNDQGSYHSSSKGTQHLVVVTEDAIKCVSLPTMKKKHRVKIKQSDSEELHVVSAHYLRVAGQSAMLIIDSEGFISIYSLPDLKLFFKENCIDASDAMGQRNFIVSLDGIMLHQRSPSEFTRGSVTEEARMEFRFSLPTKHISPLMLTPKSPKSINNGEPIFEVTQHQMVLSPQKSFSSGLPSHNDSDFHHGSPPLHRSIDYDSDDNDDAFVKSKPPHMDVQPSRFPFEDKQQPTSPETYQERAL